MNMIDDLIYTLSPKQLKLEAITILYQVYDLPLISNHLKLRNLSFPTFVFSLIKNGDEYLRVLRC